MVLLFAQPKHWAESRAKNCFIYRHYSTRIFVLDCCSAANAKKHGAGHRFCAFSLAVDRQSRLDGGRSGDQQARILAIMALTLTLVGCTGDRIKQGVNSPRGSSVMSVKAQPERNQINRGFPSSRAFVET